MGTMKSICAALVLVAAAVPAFPAQLGLSVEYNPFGHRFSDEPIIVTVTVAALEVSEKEFVRPNALDYVDFTLTSGGKEIAIARPETIGTPNSSTRSGGPASATRGIQQRAWGFEGRIRLPALPAGEYTLQGRYHDVSKTVGFTVWNGDENDDVKAAWLGREAGRATSFDAFRSLQLARLELQPFNSSILWQLANQAEYKAPIEETDRYYAQAAAVARASIESEQFRASVNEEQRSEVLIWERTIAAIRTVLPAFYKNREGLYIEKPEPRRGVTVRLIDRKTGEAVMVVDGYAVDLETLPKVRVEPVRPREKPPTP